MLVLSPTRGGPTEGSQMQPSRRYAQFDERTTSPSSDTALRRLPVQIANGRTHARQYYTDRSQALGRFMIQSMPAMAL
jgi:hypothetical protein